MAELLIFIRSRHKKTPGWGHWMDDPNEYERQHVKVDAKPYLTTAAKIANKERLVDKFNRRIQPGDITEIHEDGWWDKIATRTSKSKMPLVFACIKVPELEVKDARFLTKPDRIETDEAETSVGMNHFNRRYQANHGLNQGETITLNVSDLDITDKHDGEKVKKIGRFNV